MCDSDSIFTIETQASCTSDGSRDHLLKHAHCRPPRTASCTLHRRSSLDDSATALVDQVARLQEPHSEMDQQRVTLSQRQVDTMKFAHVASAVDRMNSLRYSNQDSVSQGDMRANYMASFFSRLDRLDAENLRNLQRYSPKRQPQKHSAPPVASPALG